MCADAAPVKPLEPEPNAALWGVAAREVAAPHRAPSYTGLWGISQGL